MQILTNDTDVLQIIRDTLERFDDANLSSEAAREAIARKAVEGIIAHGDEIEGKSFYNSHKN